MENVCEVDQDMFVLLIKNNILKPTAAFLINGNLA